jgi:hypothetical protein
VITQEAGEVISGFADAMGLIGAFLLAVPFVKTQRLRDAIVAFHRPEDIKDVEFQAAAMAALRRMQDLIGGRARKDYRLGLAGFVLIGLAFGVRLIPVVVILYHWAS